MVEVAHGLDTGSEPQPNNLDQFRDGTAQPIAWPPEAKTGTLIYPYERARQK